MKIPEKLKIMGHEYVVSFDSKLFMNDAVGGGEACGNDLSIVLAGGMPESREAEVFLHEIIEMVKYTLRIELDHKDLSALSEGLFAVLRDNELDFGDASFANESER